MSAAVLGRSYTLRWYSVVHCCDGGRLMGLMLGAGSGLGCKGRLMFSSLSSVRT
jgi:hypothetical protein